MRRVTVAIPDDPILVQGANHVYVLLSQSDTMETHITPQWKDSDGRLYHVSSGLWSDVQINGVTNPEQMAETIMAMLAIYGAVDMSSVLAAQDAFVWNEPATQGKITAVDSDDVNYAISFLGLSPIEEPVDI